MHNINIWYPSLPFYNPLTGWFKRQWWFEWYRWYSGWLGRYSGHIGWHISWWIGCLGTLALAALFSFGSFASFASLAFFASLLFQHETNSQVHTQLWKRSWIDNVFICPYLTFPLLAPFPVLLSFFFADFEASPSAHDARMRAITIKDPAFMVWVYLLRVCWIGLWQ